MEQQPEDQNQAYSIATTASALVDLGAAPDQQQDPGTILYEQQVPQADLASSMINLPSTEGAAVPGTAGITQIPISAFLTSDPVIEAGINQNPNIVGIQTHPSDTKKVQYVAIQKPTKNTSFEKLKGNNTKNITTYLTNTAQSSMKAGSKLNTLNEIFVWNKGRALIPGETVTQVQVPIIENGTCRLTECSIVFNRFIQENVDLGPNKVRVQLGNSNERFEEVQSVDGLDDMDFEVYMDHSTGEAPTVVTYKRKKPRKVSGRHSRTGRQMENYKWRDTEVVDDVARELRKSILPELVRGSPAVVKYLQAMNIPAEDLDTELLLQSSEQNITSEVSTVQPTEAQTAEDDLQNTEVNVEIGNEAEESTDTTVVDETSDNPKTDAVTALIEAAVKEHLTKTDEQPIGADSENSVGSIVISPLPTEAEKQQDAGAIVPPGDDTGPAESTSLSKETENQVVISVGSNTSQVTANNSALTTQGKKQQIVVVVGNAGDSSVKLDGTVGEIDSQSKELNVRKSYRLQIKKEKRTLHTTDQPQAKKLRTDKQSSESDSGLAERSVSSQTDFMPAEIASPGKKYGYFCSVCNKKLPPDTVLKDHLESHRMAKNRTKAKQTPVEPNVVKILAQPNKVFLYYCSLCNKMYPSEDELKEHCKQHKLENADDFDDDMDSDIEIEEATQSDEVYKPILSRPRRVSHFKNKKNYGAGIKKVYTCDICNKTSTSRAGMNQHKKVHESSEKDLTHHRCPLGCGQRFKTEMEVDLHGPFCLRNKERLSNKPEDEMEQDDTEYDCPYCHKVCDSKNGLRFHSLVCRDRPYEKCPLCDFMCKGILPMSRHQVKMHDLKPFKCDQCDKTFRLKGSLRDHVAAVHTENKYTCEHCGKKFPKMNVYKRHVFVQHGGFRYPCNYCHKRFKDKRCWRIHENSHKGAYEYSCLTCKRSFSKAPDYKQHMLEVHNIEGKEALDINKATKQLREKLCKITCSMCKEKFPLDTAFIHHLKAKHLLSEDEAMEEYQRVSGNDETVFEEEFEKIQKGEPIANE